MKIWMSIRQFWMAAALLLALLLAACQGQPLAAAPSAMPDEQPSAQPSAQSGEEPAGVLTDGSTITMVIPEDPTAFNGVAADTGYNQMVMELVLLGLSDIDPDGNVFPELAAELPTVENGGVILDEASGKMDVTWKLRQDVVWADGEPLTADDVIFTWNAITDPNTGIWTSGVDVMDSVEKVDDYTLIAHYNSIFTGYLTQFGGENLAIFPAHYCDVTEGFAAWNCNQKPLSSGPYLLEEWVTGDHLTFVRNPRYFEPGKPQIERIVVKIVPEKSVEKTMLLQGDADLLMWATEDAVADLKDKPGVEVSISPNDRWVMRLFPNLATRGQTDPEATPHPALADVRVRKAIRAAIDVDTILKEIWYGLPKPISTEFFRPPYVCDVPAPKYDPRAAQALLDEAGWKDEDGDGLRECHGCQNAAEGDPLAFELATYSEFGNELELTQQLIAEMLGKVGMKAELAMYEGSVMWADTAGGGLEQNGDFDLNLWDDGYPGIDPTDFLRYLYHSESAEPDAGWNVMRWKNAEVDALIDEAYTLDEIRRKELFCQMADILADELPIIPLFTIMNADAHTSRLQGIQSSVNDLVTWNAADWTLVK